VRWGRVGLLPTEALPFEGVHDEFLGDYRRRMWLRKEGLEIGPDGKRGGQTVGVCGGVSVSAVIDQHEVRVVSIYLFHVIIIVI